MGTPITDILVKKPVRIEDLKGKTYVVDAYNILYQFLTTIRGPDGSLLKDSKGRITSHLVGLFTRTTNLLSKGLKLIFVFDGKPPELKKQELEKRKHIKEESYKEYLKAAAEEDLEEMKKYASRTTVLTEEQVGESKKLLEAMGVPTIQAPSEGEAQCAYMVKKGDAYALISQDTDCLIFGTPLMIRNLSVTGRRKKTGTHIYQKVEPELISLAENLNYLGIDLEQLRVLAILVGTDYDVGGVKGVGPKKALTLVKKYGHDFENLFKEVKWEEHHQTPWQEILNTIKNIPVTDDYTIRFQGVDEKTIIQLLVEEHEFNSERVNKTLEELKKIGKEKEQKSLSDYF